MCEKRATTTKKRSIAVFLVVQICWRVWGLPTNEFNEEHWLYGRLHKLNINSIGIYWKLHNSHNYNVVDVNWANDENPMQVQVGR